MHVLLIQPPQADPSQPYSSLATLAAAWRHAGHEVGVRDFNLEFFNYLCEPETIKQSREEVLKRLSSGKFESQTEQNIYQQAVSTGGWLETLTSKALQVFKDPHRFYDPRVYAWAFRIMKRALYSISAAAYPGEVSLQTFRCAGSYLSSQGILEAVNDPRTNLFIRFCEERALAEISRQHPHMVAISVTFQTQMIPAWSLADQIKRLHPEIKIVLGGATITRIYDRLLKTPSLFKDIDAFVAFEGETAFPALIEEWEKGRDGLAAPNVMILRRGKPTRSRITHIEDLNTLPAPDHDGLPLDRYWCPEPALLLNVSRGCYHGRCAFCMISPASWGPKRGGNTYRVCTAEKIGENIAYIHNQTGVNTFNLSNDVLTPRDLNQIGEALENRDIDITWDSEIRLDRGLTREVLQQMYNGGCRHLRFGFESAAQRVLNLMNKKTDLQESRRIIRNCKEVGISVSLMCQIGFPGEQLDEAAETIRFLQEETQLVSFLSFSPFVLESGSDIFQHPERYGITILPNSPREDLSWMFRYTRVDGISVEDTSELYTKMEADLDQFYPDRDLFFKGGLGHAHTTLYTRRYGPGDFIKWNQEGRLRRPVPFEDNIFLRTSENLSIYRNFPETGGNWSSLFISSGEVPEYFARFNASVLMLLWLGLKPAPVKKFIQLAQTLSFNRYNPEEAHHLIQNLYEGGLLLEAENDPRAAALID